MKITRKSFALMAIAGAAGLYSSGMLRGNELKSGNKMNGNGAVIREPEGN